VIQSGATSAIKGWLLNKKRNGKGENEGKASSCRTPQQNKPVLIEKSHLTSPNSRYSYDETDHGKPEVRSFETESNERNFVTKHFKV
jgi:hypothetical protein